MQDNVSVSILLWVIKVVQKVAGFKKKEKMSQHQTCRSVPPSLLWLCVGGAAVCWMARGQAVVDCVRQRESVDVWTQSCHLREI